MKIIQRGTKIMKCNICGKEMQSVNHIKYERLYSCIGIGVFKQQLYVCDSCGFVCSSTSLPEEDVKRLYSELDDYTPLGINEKASEKRSYNKRVNNQIHFISSNGIKFNTVLDIGASTGYALSEYKKMGFSVSGIETSHSGVVKAKNIYGINLYEGTFQDYVLRYPNEKYDLITLCHVLEHINDPKKFLKDIYRINNKYIYIEIPCLSERIKNEPYGFFSEEHINYFTVQSLNELMKLCGYKPMDIKIDYCINEKIANGFPMIASLWQKEENNVSIEPVIGSRIWIKEYDNYSREHMQRLSNIIDMIDDKMPLAVWGVSFQLAKLLQYTNLRNKNIVKFYDNSRPRQKLRPLGIETTAFHIQDIEKGIVEKILITPYNSQKQIFEQIKSYGIQEKAIILYENN